MTDVSSWFIDQLDARASEPIRIFTLSGSDHSDRVVKWPQIRRNIEAIKPANINISLSNADGLYNSFHESLYTIVATCTLDMGFTHPDSGDELTRIYTGSVEKIAYKERKISLYLKDKIYDLSLRKIGSTDDHVDFSTDIPSDIAWTLCTCYGGFSTTQSSSNIDISYEDFQAWAATFSADSVTATANYQGQRVTKALTDLCEYTDSFAWVNNYGQLVFERFAEVSSNDFVVVEGAYKKFDLDIDLSKIVNKQYVSYNYSITSDYWQNQLSGVNTLSVNSYRLHEGVVEKENIWFTNSNDASSLANRRLTRLATPSRSFKIEMPLFGIYRETGDTIRFVNSFFGVTSGSGWRVSEQNINMDNLSIKIKTNEALVANGFYLDVSSLDGNDLLL